MTDILVMIPVVVIILILVVVTVGLPILFVWMTREVIRDYRADDDKDVTGLVFVIVVDVIVLSAYLGMIGKALNGSL